MKQLEGLVVDGEADLAKSTGLLVRLYGHHVFVFNSGKSVLDALEHVTPDLILSSRCRGWTAAN
jgi:CheY-like chemotaxis protein